MVSGYGAKIVECSVGPLKTDEDKLQKSWHRTVSVTME